MTRAALPQQGDTIAEKYRIERTIGAGGMSVVYGATHLVTGKRFAIKWLAPVPDNESAEAAQRFIREAQVAGRFHHPSVVEVYDVGQIDGAHYMVMEWLEGESLAARLDRAGPLSVELACEYLIPCMRAIDEAHAAGIVHRDLKPANIFLCSATRHAPARAKVLDFGIAKLEPGSGQFNPFVTRTGTLLGTPYYFAPEQLRNLPADPRSDIYAFGVTLYQALSGELPFNGHNFGELVVQIATATPRPLGAYGVAPAASAVVARAMARDPLARHQNLSELVAALEALRLGEQPLARSFSSQQSQLPAWPLESSLATESVAERSHHDAESMHERDLRDWSRWAVVVVTLLVLAGVVRWYARHAQETSVRSAVGMASEGGASARPASVSLPPSAAEATNAGEPAALLPQELPHGIDEVTPRMRPRVDTSMRVARAPVASPVLAPASSHRTRPRNNPPPAEIAPAAEPPRGAEGEAEDDNPLHMKIQ